MDTVGGRSTMASQGTERIAAFSDGVIAIIMTIMVLELKLPTSAGTGDIWSNLVEPLLPKLGVYALSFVIVGSGWVNHHQLLAAAQRVTLRLLMYNLILLFCLSLVPLAAGFLGEHPLLPRAIAFYALVMMAVAIAFGFLRAHLGRVDGHDPGHVQWRRSTLMRSVAGAAIYAVAAGLAAFSPAAALALLVAVPLIFIPQARGG